MSWMKKGPELKMPEIKVPDFLFDLYYDLKERRLLPLVAVLLAAIVAVPILLGGAAGSDSSPEEEAAIATPSSGAQESSALVVAQSAPPLRDYRRRLRHAGALDPFAQKFSDEGEEPEAAPGGETEVSPPSEGAAEVAAPGGEASLPPSPPPAAGTIEAEPGGAASGPGRDDARYASNSVDVRITAVPAADAASSSAKPHPQVRRGLPELTMLPSRKVPAAVFMGTTADGKKALLLVSSDVTSIFGDGQCVVGSKTCQLLALEAGLPETFVYGPQGRTYRIEILKIAKTVGAKPHRASLGAPKRGKKAAEVGGQPAPAAG